LRILSSISLLNPEFFFCITTALQVRRLFSSRQVLILFWQKLLFSTVLHPHSSSPVAHVIPVYVLQLQLKYLEIYIC